MDHTTTTAAHACERLAIAFANFLDARRYDELAALFTSDAVFKRGGKSIEGRAAIHKEFAGRPADLVTLHVCTNVLIEPIDDDHAKGTTYYLVLRHDGGSNGGPFPLTGLETAGLFEDQFVREPEGWRIAQRSAKGVFRRQA